MHTLLELFKNISHSSLIGIISVLGIFAFLFVMIGSGIYRVKQMLEKEDLKLK